MKLIDKDALVAEIERLREEKGTFYALDVLYNLEDFIDTLEVKEVDLEEELPVSNSLTEEGLFTFKDGSHAIITKID